jgi:FkbM family methyltransferase
MNTPRVNGAAALTRRIVGLGVLRSTPFHLVDVGASGGIDSYWELFGDSLRATGFDGLIKEVERLNAAKDARQRYYAYLVGDKSYQPPAGVPDSQPFPRTTATRAAEILSLNYAATYFDQTGAGLYATEVIELDQFFLHDHPADVDFIKVDTDGSDYQALRGARQLLSETCVLGVAVESQFHGLVHDESNTFRNIDRLLTGHGFSLFDLEVYGYSRAALPRPFVYRIPDGGQVLWGDALYLRDAGKRGYEEAWQIRLAPEKLLKLACVFEIFGMEDCAAELLLKYRDVLGAIIPLNECLDLLASAVNGSQISYAQYTRRFEQDPASFYPAPQMQMARLAARAVQRFRGMFHRNTSQNPVAGDSALSALDDDMLCRKAASLTFCRPMDLYPGWTFGVGWDSPDPEVRKLQAIWEEFRRRRLERWIPYRWYFDLQLHLYMGTDLSRQLFIAGCADPNELHFLNRLLQPGMVAVDAGANAGLYTLFTAKKLGPEGLVLAFEPSTREFKQLNENITANRLENVHCFPYALAERDGDASLLIAEYEHSGVNTLGGFVYEGVNLLCRNRVPTRRLDSVAAEIGLSRLDFMKMDVEGAEARLLQGAESVLKKFRPVLLLEVNDRALGQQGSSADQLQCALRDMYYRLYTFDASSGLPAAEQGGPSSDNIIAWPMERPFLDGH